MSEWLDPSKIEQRPEGKKVKGRLIQAMRQLDKQYKKPLLFTANGDINGRWFVYFSYINPATGKFERIKVYEDINRFKTKTERTEYGNNLIRATLELLESGWNPFAESIEQTVGGVHTLAQAIPAYLKVKDTQMRGKTNTGYKSILKQFGNWANSNGHMHKPLKQLMADEVQQYFTQSLQIRKLAATTHNSELTTIRGFFTYWQKKNLIRINPALEVKRLREEVGLHTVYSDKQIEQITTHLKQSDTPRTKQLLQYIRFLYYTCIRPKEIRMLKVQDIRPATHTILVPGSVSKSGRTEPVDISPGLAEVIAGMDLSHAKPDWYIFGNQAKGVPGDYNDPAPGPKPVGVNYFSGYYREVLNELGISEDYTLYGWKHTRNVHLWMQDKDLLRLMRYNRHTDPKVTMRYLRNLGLLIDTRLSDERRI